MDSEYRFLERVFRGPWSSIMHKLRFGLVGVAVVLVGICIWLATGLQPPEVEEDFLPSDHPINVAFETIQDGFPRSDELLQLRVRVTWGVMDIDRTGTSKFEPDKEGTPIMDDEFDFTYAGAQQQVLTVCDRFGQNTSLIFQEDTGIDPERCWVKDFLEWKNGTGFVTYNSSREQVKELLEFGNWRNSRGLQPYLTYLESQDIVFDTDQTKVVMTEVRFVSSVENQVPYQTMWPVYNDWQDVLELLNNDAPKGANNAIATGGFAWKWQITQRTLVRSMFVGVGVMLVVAVVALAAITLNWVIAVFATLCIGGIIAMLLGIIRLLGWQLGITETVGVVISIGYSFDGVAHIATAYVESKSENRFDRTRDALTDLGISILFGAVTTLCAGLMLFPAIITFFVKFAGLIVATVSLSLIWSLIIFPALLMVVGPVGTVGSLAPILRRVFFCFGRKSSASQQTESRQERDDNESV